MLQIVVEQRFVDFVRDDVELVFERKLPNLCKCWGVIDGTGRIAWTTNDNRLRSFR